MERAQDILQQILEGGTLADKMTAKHLSFDDLDWPLSAPADLLIEKPGRTGKLQPRTEPDSQTQFPKTSELKNETARGKLLHFFANHELLAIETMAYALLKFPTAPESFRRGLFRTLQDEQRHLTRYVDRMRDFGVDLGDLPLNLYFWNTLKTIQTPLDYVVQMSLTFEQANLDFAEEYAAYFEKHVSDQTTAILLREVHQDEIKHVAHGWKWFQEWKRERELRAKSTNSSTPAHTAVGAQKNTTAPATDFDFYQQALPFPMTARRARGKKYFAAQAREQAGLTPEFIESVRITGGSRGRIPSYFFFNPECDIETEVTQLSPAMKAKIADLRPLLLWCAAEEDLVELDEKPDLEFLAEVHRIKGSLPEMITRDHPLKPERVIHEFKPWGWGPGAWKKLHALANIVRERPQFEETLHSQKLFSKNFYKLLFKTPGASITTEKEWEVFRADHQKDATESWIIKSDKSTSGRGHQIISGKLPQNSPKPPPFVIEPFRKKVFDFSIQYEISRDGKITSFEPRVFKNDAHFQYQGALLGPPSQKEILLAPAIHQTILNHLIQEKYHGPVGIDALVYREDESQKIEPAIEVNARMTMGRVAWFIEDAMRKTLGQSKGVWVFLSKTQLNALGFETFEAYEATLKQQYGKYFFPTTPANTSQHTWTFVVSDEKFYSDFNAT